MTTDNWMRSRFHADPDDWRPVYEESEGTPGLGPYWCTGFADDYNIVVAYHRPEVNVSTYWPEADQLETSGPGPIQFSGRFPKPEWWDDETSSRVVR